MKSSIGDVDIDGLAALEPQLGRSAALFAFADNNPRRAQAEQADRHLAPRVHPRVDRRRYEHPTIRSGGTGSNR
jgi:hypothetical protein